MIKSNIGLHWILSFVAFLISLNFLWSQSNKVNNKSIDQIINFNFFDYNYKYLNNHFEIEIDEINYQKALEKYNFRKDIRFNYQDSLKVILLIEFDNFDYARIGSLQLTYTWNRVGLHTYENTDFLKKTANSNGLKHPYLFIKELRHEKNDNKDLLDIIINLRKKLYKKFDKDSIDSFNRRELLKFAFKNNPVVHELREKAFLKRNIKNFEIKHKRLPNDTEMKNLGLGCGKENCCQIDVEK